MAALRWDEQAQAYTESETPMKYDPTAESWTGTTGMAWDNEAQAWTEKWGAQVSAYVYGAVSETITIRKNGIIVATVQTDVSGRSTEMISLAPGTYDMTGSVSGWTEEQVIDIRTDKFRAMPEGSLYWYGNKLDEFEWYEYGSGGTYYKQEKTNEILFYGSATGSNKTWWISKTKVNTQQYSKLCAKVDAREGVCCGLAMYSNRSALPTSLQNNNYDKSGLLHTQEMVFDGSYTDGYPGFIHDYYSFTLYCLYVE